MPIYATRMDYYVAYMSRVRHMHECSIWLSSLSLKASPSSYASQLKTHLFCSMVKQSKFKLKK